MNEWVSIGLGEEEKRGEERDQYIPYLHLHEHCFSRVYIYLMLTYKVNTCNEVKSRVSG